MVEMVAMLIAVAAGILCVCIGLAIDRIKVRIKVIKRTLVGVFYFLAFWLLCTACIMSNCSPMCEISDKFVRANAAGGFRFVAQYGLFTDIEQTIKVTVLFAITVFGFAVSSCRPDACICAEKGAALSRPDAIGRGGTSDRERCSVVPSVLRLFVRQNS